MNAAELKINDLAYFTYTGTGKKEIVRVICLSDGSGEVVVVKCVGCNQFFAFASDLSGIPLTIEMLERNGWHGQSSHGEVHGWSNDFVKLYPQDRKLGGGFSFVYSGSSVRYIHYIHELQHLLWALGLDENLKI